MTRFRDTVFAVVAVAGLAAPAPAQTVYTLEAPADIKADLDKFRRGDWAAGRTLGRRDHATPYLRMEHAAAVDRFYKQDVAVILQTIEDRTHARNKARFARWVTARRFDLCAEVLVVCPDKRDAAALANSVMPTLDKIGKEAAARLGKPNGLFELPLEMRPRVLHEGQHVAEEVATVRGPIGAMSYLVRADRGVFGTSMMNGWFVACRSEVRYIKNGLANEWIDSIVFINSAMPIRRAESTLFICDGDVEFDHLWNCVIIANGDIRTGGDSTHSVLAATGNITAPGVRDRERPNLYHAGGTVTVGGKPGAGKWVKEKQKALPFGVRFLDPAEFGLELAAQNGGVQVMGITPDSPFAKYGIEDTDIITKIDDTDVTTLPAFRRALRRGVIRESVVLHVRRGDKRLTRIVFLDGVPLPVAPAPRESMSVR